MPTLAYYFKLILEKLAKTKQNVLTMSYFLTALFIAIMP